MSQQASPAVKLAKPASRTNGRVFLILGIISIVAGILCNQRLLGWALSPDGAISGFVNKLAILLLEIALIFVGFILIKNRTRPKAIAFWLILLLFWACLIPLATEFTLRMTESGTHRHDRVFYQRYYNNFHEDDGFYKILDFDPELGWKCTPSSLINYGYKDWTTQFTIDKNGFRTYPRLDVAPERAQASRRIMLTGDSIGFSQGAHDDETIDYFMLTAPVQFAWRNVSIPGWSPEQYYQGYTKFKADFKPTDLYMMVTTVNDFYIMQNATAFNRFKPTVRLHNGQPERIVEPRDMWVFKPGWDSLVWDSRLVYGLGEVLEPYYLKQLCGVTEPYGMTGDYWVDRLEIYSASRNAAGKFDHIWRRFDYIVEQVQASARQNNHKFTILIAPLGDFATVEKGSKEGITLSPNYQPITDGSIDVAIKRIREIAARHGVEVLYPEAEFNQAQAQGLAINSPEGHYGPVGNRIIANTIMKHAGLQ